MFGKMFFVSVILLQVFTFGLGRSLQWLFAPWIGKVGRRWLMGISYFITNGLLVGLLLELGHMMFRVLAFWMVILLFVMYAALATFILYLLLRRFVARQPLSRSLRLYEDRGLDGFVDGTENPQGDDNVRNVAIIPEGKPDAGGSYVLLQKYLHDLKKWDAVPTAEQEASVGRSKETNDEFSKDVRLPDSHHGRVNVKENGVGLKIVRRSLPFGKISGEHGLMFTSFCNTLHNIEVQLLNMFGDADGKTDLLLKYLSKAVSGAYYYAPSVERLQNL